MALARCRKCGHPNGRTKTYVAAAIPVGGHATAAICGRADCEEPALIWLTMKERAEYDKGQRVFSFDSCVMKVRVQTLDDLDAE